MRPCECGLRLRGGGDLTILAPLTRANNSTINRQKSHKEGEATMKNPLDSLWGTVISGLVLTAVLFVFAKNFLG
jgi:hypothetical protein